jgi:rhodanese-related sulfurtransferase
MKAYAKTLWVAALVLPALLAFAPSAAAETAAVEPAAAAFKQYPRIVDLNFVKDYAVFPKRSDVMIVDSRPRARMYDVGHIPGAVSIPDREFDQHVGMLPADKNTLLIFYCGGVKCGKSHVSAFMAEKLGYTNIAVYADGYPDWLKAGNPGAVSTAYVKKVLDGGEKVALIDARPKARQYDKGHLPGAISLSYTEFDKVATERLPADKATPLVFYCGGFACPLSDKSARKAMALGYTNVKTYPAGYPEWVATYGKDAVTVAGAASVQAPKKVDGIMAGKEPGSIAYESFLAVASNHPETITIVDVRSPAEYKAGSFRTAINLPIDRLEKEVDTLPTGKPIVFVCNTGALSGEAYDMVKLLRPKLATYFYNGMITYHKDGTFKLQPAAG